MGDRISRARTSRSERVESEKSFYRAGVMSILPRRGSAAKHVQPGEAKAQGHPLRCRLHFRTVRGHLLDLMLQEVWATGGSNVSHDVIVAILSGLTGETSA